MSTLPPPRPAPAVAVAGSLLTVSCGTCLVPTVGVPVSQARRRLPAALRALPDSTLAAQLAGLLADTGTVVLCMRCHPGPY